MSAAAAKEAESAEDTSEDSAAGQTSSEPSAQLQSTLLVETRKLAAADGQAAAPSAELQTALDGNAPVPAIAEGATLMQRTPNFLNASQQHSREPDVSAAPARSVQFSLHDPFSMQRQAPLSSVIQEAVLHGTKLGAIRRRQLADALQDAALAASQLHLALQSASAILRSEPEAAATSSQDVPVEDSRAPSAAMPGRLGKLGSSTALMLTAAAEKLAAAPAKSLSVAAAPALQLNASRKRSRLANESSAATAPDASTAVVKKQKRSEGAAGAASGARLPKKARKAKQTDHQLQPSKDMPDGLFKNPAQVDVTAGQPCEPEAALSALTSLREGVQAWRADKATKSAEIPEDSCNEEAGVGQASADASEVALVAQPVAGADAAEIPGLAAEKSTSAAPQVSAPGLMLRQLVCLRNDFWVGQLLIT